MIGLDVGLVRKIAPGTLGRTDHPRLPGTLRDRPTTSSSSAGSTRSDPGVNVDGPDAWDGYAAAAVCEAGVESLETGEPVEVEARRPRFDKGA